MHALRPFTAICHRAGFAVQETQIVKKRDRVREDPRNENSKHVMMKHFHPDNSTKCRNSSLARGNEGTLEQELVRAAQRGLDKGGVNAEGAALSCVEAFSNRPTCRRRYALMDDLSGSLDQIIIYTHAPLMFQTHRRNKLPNQQTRRRLRLVTHRHCHSASQSLVEPHWRQRHETKTLPRRQAGPTEAARPPGPLSQLAVPARRPGPHGPISH